VATTNFARLTNETLTVWKRDIWRQGRNESFLHEFVGDGNNAMIQRVKEQTQTRKGARAVITLVRRRAESARATAPEAIVRLCVGVVSKPDPLS